MSWTNSLFINTIWSHCVELRIECIYISFRNGSCREVTWNWRSTLTFFTISIFFVICIKRPCTWILSWTNTNTKTSSVCSITLLSIVINVGIFSNIIYIKTSRNISRSMITKILESDSGNIPERRIVIKLKFRTGEPRGIEYELTLDTILGSLIFLSGVRNLSWNTTDNFIRRSLVSSRIESRFLIRRSIISISSSIIWLISKQMITIYSCVSRKIKISINIRDILSVF